MYAVIQDHKMIGGWRKSYEEAEELAKQHTARTKEAVSILKEVAIVTIPPVEPTVTSCD